MLVKIPIKVNVMIIIGQGKGAESSDIILNELLILYVNWEYSNSSVISKRIIGQKPLDLDGFMSLIMTLAASICKE